MVQGCYTSGDCLSVTDPIRPLEAEGEKKRKRQKRLQFPLSALTLCFGMVSCVFVHFHYRLWVERRTYAAVNYDLKMSIRK